MSTRTPTIDISPAAAGLRRMKLVATSFLVGAAALFVLARSQHSDPEWWGYVEAFAEAAMVGALADWFAVTALFRHPLGLPIPHTAIIPRRKDQIARSLGSFVEANFLSTDVIHERLRSAQVGRRIGQWLADPDHATTAAAALADGIHSSLRVLDDRELREGVERAIDRRLRETPIAPLAGRGIQVAMANDQHDRLFDAVLGAAHAYLAANRAELRAQVGRESPWWVPAAIDNRIFTKVYDGVARLLGEVQSDPNHPMRRSAEARLAAFAQRLRDDPQLREKGEQLKTELMTYPDVRQWMESVWDDVKVRFLEASGQADSEFRVRLAATLQRLGGRLRDDAELQGRVDRTIERLVGYVVTNYHHEVTELIESTIAKWDPASTSRRIELQIGRDLQFIRINGTVVGGLAGVAIHAMSEFVF